MDAGARRASTELTQQAFNPMATLSSAGSQQYQERFRRHLSEPSLAHEKRQELREKGLIRFIPDAAEIPDVGGPLRRTRTGQVLKTQAYFSRRRDQNLWDLPAHSGVSTWRVWHGPKMRTDAEMMQRLDEFEAEQATHEAHRLFVNTVRLQTLDRFYNQKLEHENYATAIHWAPHRKTKKEVHDLHATFMADLDEKPVKQLKKVLTKAVLKKDREAVRQITKRMQVEETWKEAWKHWEQQRRQDLIVDLEDRRRHNTMLQYLSGQPVREPGLSSSTRSLPNNCTTRVEELAQPRPPWKPKDVTANTDFRGLAHVDHEHALEAMFPGYGHDLTVEFRSRATASTQAGWPAPVKLTTPRKQELKDGAQARAATASAANELAKASVPMSTQRVGMTATRRDDELLEQHAQAQFLPTRAPPAPDQRKTLMKEDWSPKATMNDPARLTGGFTRTDVVASTQKSTSQSGLNRSMTLASVSAAATTAATRGEQKVPPTRDVTYPIIAPTSPQAAKATASTSFGMDGVSKFGTTGDSFGTESPRSNATGSPKSARKRRLNRAVTQNGAGASRRGSGPMSDDSDDDGDEPPFGGKITPMPRLCNFFGPPQATGGKSRRSTAKQVESPVQEPEEAPASVAEGDIGADAENDA
mmetsp:Transcript_73063/g.174067  ORF Transcript_73063/g.174067 Transcript_73063/m.174067 type:complete len:642 (-) Transcript_73063:105-2030(-)|eukprot:CAMPEP_0178388422 /NCGR_PEP_ID=MMETSP0689_2-20121128/9585_1 /TAXON_ID=160604 /ORGANISM="Amphidinium massartii, Strain CS-259" /LENGTH=641 /DNA_ID=CAMNT_0020008825 /DNA_START=36 /DNA_END=1961 /DNA_ORIENTATION=+